MITTDNLLTRFVTVALYTAVMAGMWDFWWHVMVGRDSFWEPPHILLYTMVLAAITCGVYGWYRTRERRWRRLAILLALVPLSAPFDEIWHRLFGVENFSSPLVLWSPPHVVLILAITGALMLLLPLIRRERDLEAQRIFGALAWAAILALLLALAAPLDPTGPYHLWGFWGAGVLAFVFAMIVLMARQWMPGLAGATLVIASYILLSTMGFEGKTAPRVIAPPHEHPPVWLMTFSLLLPALVIDLIKQLPLWLSGTLLGLLWGGILYGFSSSFYQPEFQYTVKEFYQAGISSLVGGISAGITASLLSRKRGRPMSQERLA